MSSSRSNFEIILMALMLITAVAAYAFLIFFVSDPVLRLRLGLLALGPILWPAIWMARQFDATAMLGTDLPRRRYSKLRGVVQQLLVEITRLNWTVIDSEHRLRDHGPAEREIAAIKSRMSEILEEVKEAAGQPQAAGEEPMPRQQRWTIEAPASQPQ